MKPDPARDRRRGRRRAAPAGLPGGDGVPPRPRRLSAARMSAGAAPPTARCGRSSSRRPESIHDLTLDLLRTAGRTPPWLCRFASGVGEPSGGAGRAHRASIPQPRRARRRVRQGRHGDRGLGGARLRVRRAGHRHPRRRPGNPRPRLFRLSRGPGAHQPHGIQQRRRRGARRRGSPMRGRGSRQASWSASTSAATATRTPTTTQGGRRVADGRRLSGHQRQPPEHAGPRASSRTERAPRSIVDRSAEAAPGRPILVKLSPDCHSDATRSSAVLDRCRAGVILVEHDRHAATASVRGVSPRRRGLSGAPCSIECSGPSCGGARMPGSAGIVASGGIACGAGRAARARGRSRPRPAVDRA